MDSSHLVKANASAMREAAPANPLEFGPVVPQVQPWLPSQESALREYFRVLIKRKWTVLGVLATIFSLVAVASFKMTPIYEAVGRIAINRPDTNVVNFKDSPGSGADYYDPSDLDTEVSILQSDLLALQVIKTLKLDKMPEFGGRPDTGPIDNLAPDPLQTDSPT